MLNRVVIQGRIGKDIELRHTQSGVSVVSFSIAVDRDFKDKATGEKTTDWVNVTAWRSTAEFVSKYFSKGRMAVVEGRLQIRDWTDREGGKRRSAEVVADNIYFGDSKRDAEAGAAPSYGQGGGYSQSYGAAPAPAPSSDFAMLEGDDAELPF